MAHVTPSMYHRSAHVRGPADRALSVASAWPGGESTTEDVTGDVSTRGTFVNTIPDFLRRVSVIWYMVVSDARGL